MSNERLSRVVAALRVLRGAHPTLTALHLELLLMVAQGIDRRPDLIATCGAGDGSVRRALRTLTGRGYLEKGHICQSGVRLLRTTKHPHLPGVQFHLTEEAAALLRDTDLANPITPTSTHASTEETTPNP